MALVTGLLAYLGILTTLLFQTRTAAKRAEAHAASANDQVTNHHDTNLREESDDRHDELMAALSEVKGDVRGLRRDVGRLWDSDNKQNDRIIDLERTQPREEALRHARSRWEPRDRDNRDQS